MSKLTQFKARCSAKGQSITLTPFSAWPATGADTWGGGPDPDDAAYPATRPAPTYGTPVALSAFVQPARQGSEEGSEVRAEAPWGDLVTVKLFAYLPGDQAVNAMDKVTFDGDDYWVVGFDTQWDGTTKLYHKLHLTTAVPR